MHAIPLWKHSPDAWGIQPCSTWCCRRSRTMENQWNRGGKEEKSLGFRFCLVLLCWRGFGFLLCAALQYRFSPPSFSFFHFLYFPSSGIIFPSMISLLPCSVFSFLLFLFTVEKLETITMSPQITCFWNYDWILCRLKTKGGAWMWFRSRKQGELITLPVSKSPPQSLGWMTASFIVLWGVALALVDLWSMSRLFFGA